MAKSEPIKHTDIAEDDVTRNMRESFEKTLVVVNEFEGKLKDVAKGLGKDISSPFNPKTLKEVKDYSDTLKKVDAVEKANTETLKNKQKVIKALTVDQAKLRQERLEENNIAKQTAILTNAEVGSVERLRAELALVTIEWKKTSDAKQLDINVTGSLAQKKKILTEQLKHLEGVTGDHRREVGAYTESLIKLGRGLGGLTGLIATIGQAFGIELGFLEELHQTSKEFIKTSRELHHATELNTVATKENTVALTEQTVAEEAQKVAEEEESVVREASTGLIGLAAIAIIGITAVIYDLVTATDTSKLALDDLSKSIDKVGNEDSDKFLEAMGQKADQLGIAILTLKGNIQGLEGLLQDPTLTKETREATEKELITANTKLKGLQLEQTKDELDIELEGQKAKIDVNEKGAKEKVEARLKEIEKLKKINEKRLDESMEDVNREQEENNKYVESQEEYFARIERIKKSYDEEEKALNKDLVEIQKDADKKKLENQKTADKKTKEERDKEEQDLADWAARMEKLYESVYQKGFNKPSEMTLKKLDVDLSAGDDEANRKNNAILKAKEDAKKLREKKIDDAFSVADAELKIFQSLQDKKLKLEQEYQDRKLSNIENDLKIQADRAALGLSNTYDQELKLKAKALDDQAKLDKKAKREKEIQGLEQVYLEYMKVFAKDGWAGIGKAVAATSATEAVMLALGSGFYEGTESLGENNPERSILKLPTSRDNLFIRAHRGERIFGVEDSEKVKGLTNDDLVTLGQNYLNGNYFPEEIGLLPASMHGADMTLLRNAILSQHKELIETVRESGGPKWDLNKQNEWLRTEWEKGIKTTTVLKRLG